MLNNENHKPIFKHDCNQCVFLANFIDTQNKYDLYFCKQGGILPTVIARYGNDGPEYTSGLNIPLRPLIHAQYLATQLGYLLD